jgi:hypothetical protein
VHGLPGNRLLGLKLSAERVRFGSSDWNGFSFSLDKAVPFARAGEAFRIPGQRIVEVWSVSSGAAGRTFYGPRPDLPR